MFLELFTAIQFFTRIPVPDSISKNYSQELLNRSRTYFPFIGWIVAGVMSISYVLLTNLFSIALTVVLTIIIGILITGAFHEDGFADVCDGFGGGYNKDRILIIMKDSRLGTYGTIGVVILLGLRYLCLFELAVFSEYLLLGSLFFSHSGSRFFASLASNILDYVREEESSKIKPIAQSKLSSTRMGVGLLFVILPSFFLMDPIFILSIIPALFSFLYFIYFFNKHIGGYTGDCLGAIQQITESVIYLSLLGILKFYSLNLGINS